MALEGLRASLKIDSRSKVAFVDLDDTLIRSGGKKLEKAYENGLRQGLAHLPEASKLPPGFYSGFPGFMSKANAQMPHGYLAEATLLKAYISCYLKEHLPLEKTQLEAIAARVHEAAIADRERVSYPLPRVYRTLSLLKNSGYKVVLTTARPVDQVERLNALYGLHHIVDGFLFAENLDSRRPPMLSGAPAHGAGMGKPSLIAHLAQKFDPNNVGVLDDASGVIRAAREAGLHGVQIDANTVEGRAAAHNEVRLMLRARQSA